MEGGVGVVLWDTLIGSLILFAGGFFPALSLLRILDPLADFTRRLMLIPALSLLVNFAVAGWLVVLTNRFDVINLLLLLLLVNSLAGLFLWQRDVVRVRRLSQWELLAERMDLIESEGVLRRKRGGEREDEKSVREVEEDVQEKQRIAAELAAGRPAWLPLALAASALLSLLPLLLFEYPNGVDWVGFSTLTHSLASRGTLDLPAISEGSWTYPPAFPAVAALLESLGGIPPASAIHLLGQLSLFALLWGVAGAADRWGAAGPTLVALALGPALFIKAHDSGYPTVASQLGLVIGLLVLVRPQAERKRGGDLIFALSVITTGAIHPTGAIYLGCLLAAYLVAHRFGFRSKLAISRLALTSTAVLSLAIYIVLVIFAPRLFSEPVFSEYGWQGGGSLIMFNGPILVGLGLWSAWRGRNSVEVILLATWLTLNWALTLIHLLSGIIAFSVLTLLSYVLYSMALHAFHLPLAILTGILLAANPRLSPRQRPMGIDERGEVAIQRLIEDERGKDADAVAASAAAENEEGTDESPVAGSNSSAEDGRVMWLPRQLPTPVDGRVLMSILIFVVFQLTIANFLLIDLADHPELRVQTDGDRKLMSTLSLPAGSVIFTEDAHWGNVYDLPEDVGITTFPSLGLVDVRVNHQGKVKSAILRDDVETLNSLGVSHALTSPLGSFGSVLASSYHWQVLKDVDGSRLWELHSQPTMNSAITSTFVYPEKFDCIGNCQWRVDAWRGVDADQLQNRPSSQPFLTDGEIELEVLLFTGSVDATVKLNLMVDAPAGLEVRMTTLDGDEVSNKRFVTHGGWQQMSMVVETPVAKSITVSVDVSGGGDGWVNPLGITGRGDRVFDEDGVRIHWLEMRPMVA